MKMYTSPLGRLTEVKHEHPERTARWDGSGIASDVTFQVWPSRVAMARSIRKQEQRASSYLDWKALIPLTDGEGY